jgi:hypothetical protein
LRVRRRGETPPDVGIQVGPTGLPGTPRSVTATMFTPYSNVSSAVAASRNSSSCAAPVPALKETRTTAPLRPGTDRGSGPITALPTGFWRAPPKATHPISKCQKAQETTPAKSALQGIPHPATGRRRWLHPPRRMMMMAPARALRPVMAKPSDSSPSARSASARTARRFHLYRHVERAHRSDGRA